MLINYVNIYLNKKLFFTILLIFFKIIINHNKLEEKKRDRKASGTTDPHGTRQTQRSSPRLLLMLPQGCRQPCPRRKTIFQSAPYIFAPFHYHSYGFTCVLLSVEWQRTLQFSFNFFRKLKKLPLLNTP